MPTSTPRLGLPRPSAGDPADGPDLANDITDALDPKVVIFAAGTAAARPAAGTTGRLYWNSDTKQLDYDDGSAWNSSSPGEPPIGSLQMWPNAIKPANNKWLICDGTTVSSSTYAKLALILGESGGVVTLPNFVGRFPVGPGAVPGVATAKPAGERTLAVKAQGGVGDHQLAGIESGERGHDHAGVSQAHGIGQGLMVRDGATNGSPGNVPLGGTGWALQTGVEFVANPNRWQVTLGNTQADTPDVAAAPVTAATNSHQNMPPYFAVYFIIRAL